VEVHLPQLIMKYRKWFLIGGTVCFVAIILLYLFIPSNPTIAIQEKPLEITKEKTPSKQPIEEEVLTIFVDVKGAVKKPGIYKAKNGERTNDLIQRAGGFSDQAEEKSVNLAQKVQDEMVIYVPTLGEEPSSIPTQPHGSESESKINLNEGSEEELMKIPGIGPSKARAIIDFREKEGLFKSIEELKNVSGIGEKTYEKLKNAITT
jgi:competence protein ComEA